MISRTRLRELLDYNRVTGVFRWKYVKGEEATKRLPGKIAGGPRSKHSYIQLGLDGKRYYAHRVAWFYVYGTWPKYIDHRDRNKQNNALLNLREASVSQNGFNRRADRKNKLGVKGVRKDPKYEIYEARICINGEQIALGWFRTVEQAKEAYKHAAQKFHGEFACWE